MQLYLSQQHCSRAVLSQFLDASIDWRWCMPGDEPCQVCGTANTISRPVDLLYALPRKGQLEFTGPSKVLRQDHIQDEVLDKYKADLGVMVDTCLYCQVEGRKFNHLAGKCSRRFQWINAKNEAYQAQKSKGKKWI